MAAGESAGAESVRQLALAEAHEQAAAEARARAGRYGVAAVTEKQTARTLAPLAGIGYHLLADRRWPGARRAQVDLVVVGPGGVFVVDTKAWKDVSIHGGRVFRGDEDVTDDFLTLADLGDTVQAALAEVGLAPGEVHVLVVLAGRTGIDVRIHGVRLVGERDVLRRISANGQRLTAAQVDVVLARALELFPLIGTPPPVNVTVVNPVLPASKDVQDLQDVREVQDALLSPEEINDALLSSVLAQPIEDWMAFLHPQQAKLVRRSFAGPSRIRGAAGTGKTVVGLHRAAHLARTKQGRVLVTTYVRTLPEVLRELLGRMAPEVVDRVDFMGVHAFASRLLSERGVTYRLEPTQTRNAFERAWASVGARSVLARTNQDKRYWHEEIQYVLKGRGITRFEDYADLPRTGRRHRLVLEGRRAVWDLYQAYDADLRRRGVHDYADLILLAEAELAREPLRGYDAVVVDEAQDLSCAMVRMLHALVGDAPDAFTLIGDGQQSIYPGGYTLGEAGLSVAGRGVVLDINYRNTAQILAFAQRLVDGDEYPDIEGAVSRGDAPAGVPRSGVEPVTHLWVDHRGLREAVTERVRAVTREVGTALGDVAVLCTTRAEVGAYERALTSAGVPVVLLEKYAGRPVDAVKVGTIKRAKGLEFKQVLIPDVRLDLTSPTPPEDDVERERWELGRRELYVAMTRARDGLWVGVRAGSHETSEQGDAPP